MKINHKAELFLVLAVVGLVSLLDLDFDAAFNSITSSAKADVRMDFNLMNTNSSNATCSGQGSLGTTCDFPSGETDITGDITIPSGTATTVRNVPAGSTVSYASGSTFTATQTEIQYAGEGAVRFLSGSVLVWTQVTAVFTSAVSFLGSMTFTSITASFASFASVWTGCQIGGSGSNAFSFLTAGVTHQWNSVTSTVTDSLNMQVTQSILQLTSCQLGQSSTFNVGTTASAKGRNLRTLAFTDLTAASNPYTAGTTSFSCDTIGTLTANNLAAVVLDASCTNTVQPTTDVSLTNPATTTATDINMVSGSLLQFQTVTSTSGRFFSQAMTAFDSDVDVQNTDTSAYSRVIAVIGKTSSQTCPTKACNIAGCADGHECSCTWGTSSGSSGAEYCTLTFNQKGDDSNDSLWALLALLIIPVLGICAFFMMKNKKKEPEAVYAVAEPEAVQYPEVAAVAEYPEVVTEVPGLQAPTTTPAYPTTQVQYPMEEFYAGQPTRLNVSPY